MIPRPLPLEERLRFNREYREVTGPAGEVIHLRSGPRRRDARAGSSRLASSSCASTPRIYLKLDWTGGPDSAQFDEIAERLSFAIGTAGDVAQKIWDWTDQFDGTEETAIQFQGPGVSHANVLDVDRALRRRAARPAGTDRPRHPAPTCAASA